MIRAIIDEVVPADFVGFFEGSEINVSGFPDEWRSLPDGGVIDRAVSAGFDWLITCDKRMPFQQNLSGSSLSVMVLPTPQIPKLRGIVPALTGALTIPVPGRFVVLDDEGKPSAQPVPHMIGRGRKKS